jgi:preprotein translocase subunit YajC
LANARIQRYFYNLKIGVFVFISNAYAQSTTAADPGLMGNLTTFLPLVLMFVVMYFLMIRPQQKRQKETKAMMEALGKGDEVATAGGILGKVSKVSDTYVTIEVAPGTELTVQKSAITTLLPKGTLKSL